MAQRVLAVLISGLGACKRSPPPVEPVALPAPPPAATAAAPADDVCRASVGWRDGSFAVAGLPCIRRDGAEIVFAKTDERPRYPDLTVVAVTRADKLARHAIVMEPHESELLDGARAPTPELTDRIAKANALLADAGKDALPLAPFETTRAGTHAGQGIEVAWTEAGRLTISREGNFVYQGDYNRWLEKLVACTPPSYLDKVWGDAARGVLLIKIAYRGSGGCTALPELHVISWTP